MSEFAVLLTEHSGLATLRGRVLRCAVATDGVLDRERVAVMTAFLQAIADTETPNVGAVLLFGEGPSFCAGTAVGRGENGEPEGWTAPLNVEVDALAVAISQAPVPVICAVHGWAVGASMSIPLASDVVVGGPAAKFRPVEPCSRSLPTNAISWILPRVVGAIRARDLLLTDGIVSGAEAERLGLITRLVPDHRVPAEAQLVAEQLAVAPGEWLGAIKRLGWESTGRSLAEHLSHAERCSVHATASRRNRLP